MKKVSVLVPCYNSEIYIENLIKSILAQTYKKLEVIFINDGSTDRTEEIILSYQKSIIKKGVEFKYIKIKNSGQSAALNEGLKIFTGEFLTWPDSDDIMLAECIQKKVEFLEKNKMNMVMSDCFTSFENQINKAVGILKGNKNSNLFKNFLLGEGVYYAPIGFLIRAKVFLEAYPKREIYVSQRGGSQNAQILLPISLKNSWGYLEEVLAIYLIRENSYSRSWKSYDKAIERIDYLEEIFINTLLEMRTLTNKQEYIDMVKIKNIKSRFNLELEYYQFKKARVEYSKLKVFLKKMDRIKILLKLINYFCIKKILKKPYFYLKELNRKEIDLTLELIKLNINIKK